MARRLENKLFLGFSVIIAVMALMIVIFLAALFHFSAQMDQLVNREISELSLLNELKGSLVNQSHLAYDFASSQKPELLAEMNHQDQKIRSMLSDLNKRKDNRAVKRLTAAYGAFWAQNRAMIDGPEGPNIFRVKKMGAELRRVAITRINAQIEEVNLKIKEISSRGRTDLTLAIPFLIVLFIMTLILSAIISVRITRSITHPVGQLLTMTRRINQGDLSARSQIRQVDEIGLLSDSFNEMAASLEKLFNEQKIFLADASHELKTPLTVIQGYAEVALLSQEVRCQPELINRFEAILLVAERMKKIVGELLFLSKASMNTLPLERKEIDLKWLLESIEADASILTRMKNIDFALTAEPAAIVGDESKIKQLFFILLDNAVKFTPPGGSVEVTSQPRGNRVILSFKDSGKGIPEKDLPYVFNRFYQADASHSGAGAGLGLAIARAIVEAHGGGVTVVTHEGKGSTFHLEFPRKERHESTGC